MTTSVKVKYLAYPKIEEISKKVLTENDLIDIIPIDVERYLDNILGLNIIEFENLHRFFGINAFTTIDIKKIYVDKYLYNHLENQYRFTLAHELGHIVLHKYIYSSLKITSFASYQDFLNEFDEREYGAFEFQANCFSGLFLVPSNHLEEQFHICSQGMINFIKNKFKGIKREDYIEMAIDLISKKLSVIFKVHHRPIQIRIQKSGLLNKIP